MIDRLHFDYPELPESVNKLYIVQHGRKILSARGRKYKNNFLLARGGLDASVLMNFVPYPEETYALDLTFFLSKERIFNLGYGRDKRVKSPYADIDTSNLIKLIEDCIATLTGLRDRNNWDVYARKRVAADGVEKVVATLSPTVLEEKDTWWHNLA